MHRTLFYAVIIIALLMLFIPSTAEELTISNQYIKISPYEEDEIGFTAYTVEGDPDLPNDNNFPIIEIDDSFPPSTFATLYVDDDYYIVGDWDGDMEEDPRIVNDQFTYSWLHDDDIMVKQKVYIVEGPTTHREDTVMIEYFITNMDDEEHEVGLRLVIDTWVAHETGAGFMVYDADTMEDITLSGETEYFDEAIPLYWFQFDDPVNPTKRTQGSMYYPGFDPPSKLVFANWTSFYEDMWDIDLDEGDDFYRTYWVDSDSAVGVYWGPVELMENETMQIGTMFGVYGEPPRRTPELEKELVCSTYGPYYTVKNPDPFTITAIVENVGDVEITGGEVQIKPPDGFTYQNGDTAGKPLSPIPPGQTTNVEWSFAYMPDYDSGEFGRDITKMYTIEVLANYPDGSNLECQSAGNVDFYFEEPQVAERSLDETPAPPTPQLTVEQPDDPRINIEATDLWSLYNEIEQEITEVDSTIVHFNNAYTETGRIEDSQEFISHHEQNINQIESKVQNFENAELGIRRSSYGNELPQ